MIWWIKRLFWNIKRVFKWLPVIWHDREFDHSYFLQILSFKLKLMEDFYHSKYAISADRKDCATKIHVCKLLCDRLITNDYYFTLGRKIKMYPNNKGILQFEILEEGCQLGICKDLDHYESYMQKQDLKLLCKIIQKNLFSWWD